MRHDYYAFESFNKLVPWTVQWYVLDSESKEMVPVLNPKFQRAKPCSGEPIEFWDIDKVRRRPQSAEKDEFVHDVDPADAEVPLPADEVEKEVGPMGAQPQECVFQQIDLITSF